MPLSSNYPKVISNFRTISWLNQKGICHYCKQKKTFKQWSVDHIIPRARGGNSQPENKIGCCRQCNSVKSCLTEIEFRTCGYLENLVNGIHWKKVKHLATSKVRIIEQNQLIEKSETAFNIGELMFINENNG